uniref:Uncharacterized protein n=1 Tax=Rhizophora mucronata TaxID=61149 RepID=A0A2P2QH94_RHIMU
MFQCFMFTSCLPFGIC